jgi:hypothetical protein
MIETTGTQEWFVWGVHRTDSPHAVGASSVVVELPAVKEMISLVAGGHVEERDLLAALDACTRRPRTADDETAVMAADWIMADRIVADRTVAEGPAADGPAADGPDGGRDVWWGEDPDDPADAPRHECRAGYEDACGSGCTDACPEGCPVCLGARAEFDAIAAASYTHKVRLSDPVRHPYAAEKNTLHQRGCARVARFVGHVEPLGSPQSLAALPAFAHHGVCTTAWAAGMQVMTMEEAVAWARRQVEPPDGAGYKLCRHCRPTVPGTGTSDPWACAAPAES